MSKKPSLIDRLNERMRKNAKAEDFLLIRNLVYGGGATCLIILLALSQIGVKVISLKIALVSSSAAIPMWIVLGVIYEFFIFLGDQSFAYFRSGLSINIIGITGLIASIGTLISISSVIWYLMPLAA